VPGQGFGDGVRLIRQFARGAQDEGAGAARAGEAAAGGGLGRAQRLEQGGQEGQRFARPRGGREQDVAAGQDGGDGGRLKGGEGEEEAWVGGSARRATRPPSSSPLA
jgi:hypothetical protein